MSSPRQSPAPLTPVDELARMMREVTPVEGDEDQDSGGGQQTSSPSGGTVSSTNREEDGVLPSSGPQRSNEQHAARRRADRLNLLPYQKEAVHELIKLTPVGQNALLYSQQCVIENKLDKIIASTPVYQLTPALKANIDSVVVAVLLSSKLSAYKRQSRLRSYITGYL